MDRDRARLLAERGASPLSRALGIVKLAEAEDRRAALEKKVDELEKELET